MRLNINKSPWTWIPTLYFAQGLPYIAVTSLSVTMYKSLGMGNAEIAFYTGWLTLPWVIKPFWSPFVDLLKSKRWWIIAMQIVLAVGLAALSFAIPASGVFQTTLAIFWLTAFASATFDIAADGFYILALTEHQQSLYVGIRSTFYRAATLIGQGVLVYWAGIMEVDTGDVAAAWSNVFLALSLMFAAFAIYQSLRLPHPVADNIRGQNKTPKEICNEFISTFVKFFKKPQIATALCFMLLYRLPEAQLVKLITPFLLDGPEAGGLGLTTSQVGITYGTVGIIGLTLGGIIGGLVAANGGLKRWLMPMAWSMSLTCLTFVYLSFAQQPSLAVINSCVFIEQFGYGFGFTAYMLYLIYFAEGPLSTSHYAICTGFMAMGMMLPGMAAGWLQENLGYQNFFIWTVVCCIATIGVASMLKIPASFGLKKTVKS